jgi:hypothetical protein
MDKIEVAFKEHKVTSLKELKRLLYQVPKSRFFMGKKEQNNAESEQKAPIQKNPLAA